MKAITITAVLLLACAGCATNESANAGDESSAGAKPASKSSCSYERSNRGISRLRRVCRDAGG